MNKTGVSKSLSINKQIFSPISPPLSKIFLIFSDFPEWIFELWASQPLLPRQFGQHAGPVQSTRKPFSVGFC